ncbi:MAG: hypothetical protein H6825_02265 [Planctomycetes bacterium]|nr:hypothetical protein [Planctomycetota bacterium]
MVGIIKTLLRVGVITTACAGTAVLVAGPERAGALLHQAHEKVLSAIDSSIEDPVALRAQLRELEAQYPERITQVRGDLAELTEQMRQLQRERDISDRVVALADRDLGMLEPLLSDAAAASVQTASARPGIGSIVSVRFDDRTYTLDQASTRANQIRQTKVAYANRAADAAHDLVYLQQQSEQMGQLLDQLETERAQFQAQLWQLDRQVDAIARNEKLIDMLGERKKTIEQLSGFQVASLDQMVARLAEVRVRQQAELDTLTDVGQQVAYEDVARMQLETESGTIGGGQAAADDVQTLVYRSTDGAAPKLR